MKKVTKKKDFWTKTGSGMLVLLLLFCQIPWTNVSVLAKEKAQKGVDRIILHCYKQISLLSYLVGKEEEELGSLEDCDQWFHTEKEKTEIEYSKKEENKNEKKEKIQQEESETKEYENASTLVKQIVKKPQLEDFSYMMQNFYVIDQATYVDPKDFNMYELSKKDLSLKQDSSKPQILIYHTHSQEMFKDSVEGDIRTSIVGVGDYLTELLEGYGYKVIHDRGCYDLVNGVLDRNLAYEYSRNAVKKQLEKHPEIEVVIDLHRDGISKDVHLTTDINGRKTAQIMFFNGLSRMKGKGNIATLENKNLETNMAMSLQMKLAAMANYPGLTRRNYLNAYKYNLDLRPKSMLIEAGAQTNTVEEEKNAMIPLADLLHKILK